MTRNREKSYSIAYQWLIAADGAVSRVRQLVTGRTQNLVTAFLGNCECKYDSIILETMPDAYGYLWYIPNACDGKIGCTYKGIDK